MLSGCALDSHAARVAQTRRIHIAHHRLHQPLRAAQERLTSRARGNEVASLATACPRGTSTSDIGQAGLAHNGH